jgi:hypothetical protein
MPPGLEKLRTTLLVKAKKEVDKMLKPIKSAWPSSGVSIVSDGWTNIAHHPLINFVVSSLNRPIFLKVVDALGKYKDAQLWVSRPIQIQHTIHSSTSWCLP